MEVRRAGAGGPTSGLSIHSPITGPSASHGSTCASGHACAARTNSSMLTTEMAKPMQLLKVSTLPTTAGGAFCAVSVENWGESPETVAPHSSIQAMNSGSGATSISGAARQQAPLAASCRCATRALPRRRAASPPATQPTKPAAITQNDAALTAAPARRVASTTGTSTISAYSSHMCPK
jgi:hypothetical protein